MKQLAKRGLAGPPPLGKKARTGLRSLAEALVIHMLALAEPNRPRLEVVDGVEEILLDVGYHDCTVQLSREMEAATKHSLVNILREYRDVFAFGLEEMYDIDAVIIEHRLNVDPTYKTVIQKKRHMGPKMDVAATTEV